jgi:hypothetical protein
MMLDKLRPQIVIHAAVFFVNALVSVNTGFAQLLKPPPVKPAIEKQALVPSSVEGVLLSAEVTGTITSAKLSWVIGTPPGTVTVANPSRNSGIAAGATSSTQANSGPLQAAPETIARAGSTLPQRAQSFTIERILKDAAPFVFNPSPLSLQFDDVGPLKPGSTITYRLSLTDSRGVVSVKTVAFSVPYPGSDSRASAVPLLNKFPSITITGTPTTATISVLLPPEALANSIGKAQTTLSAANTNVSTQTPTIVIERIPPGGGQGIRIATTPSEPTKAIDLGPLVPGTGTTYRVTYTGSDGKVQANSAVFTPPMPRDPTNLRVSTPAPDGSYLISWDIVPESVGYQITGFGISAPINVRYANQWRSPPYQNSQTIKEWRVASLYEPGGVLTSAVSWPMISTAPRVINDPVPGIPFLSLSAPTSAFPVASRKSPCVTHPGFPLRQCGARHIIDFALDSPTFFDYNALSRWQSYWDRDTGAAVGAQQYPVSENPRIYPAPWPRVSVTNLLDFEGLHRALNCAPKQNGKTTCWANSNTQLTFIAVDDLGADFESFEGEPAPQYPPSGIRTWFLSWMDAEFSATQGLGTERKTLTSNCFACHGGTFDATTNRFKGASLLPIVPSRTPVTTRVAPALSEEEVRKFNLIVLNSNPAPAIIDQIWAMYDNAPMTVGKKINPAAVPPDWAAQGEFYKKVFEPYCAGCHFAFRNNLSFRTFQSFLQMKPRVEASVCKELTMPHSAGTFKKFWSSGAIELFSSTLNLPNCLSDARAASARFAASKSSIAPAAPGSR